MHFFTAVAVAIGGVLGRHARSGDLGLSLGCDVVRYRRSSQAEVR